MHVNAHLDLDLVALETADRITLMLDLTAPDSPGSLDRPGQAVEVVLDRSGSMQGAPFEAAKQSLLRLVDRLAPQDSFGLVIFDDSTTIISPLRTMKEHHLPSLRQAILAMEVGGSTNISSGYLLGLNELSHAKTSSGSTLILISDGHANAGECNPDFFLQVAQKAALKRVTTSSIGLGTGYDEVLLEAAAQGGGGVHRFAATIDEAIGAIAEEVEHLLDKSVVNTVLRIKPITGVHGAPGVELLQPFPILHNGDEYLVQLGDMYAGENRRFMIDFEVPQLASLGLTTIAELTLEYLNLEDHQQFSVMMPVMVNVVPQDVADGRVPNPIVRAEHLVLTAQGEKSKAISDLRNGNDKDAITRLKTTATNLRRSASEISVVDEISAESLAIILTEATDLEKLATVAENETIAYSSKRMTESFSNKVRSRKFTEFKEEEQE